MGETIEEAERNRKNRDESEKQQKNGEKSGKRDQALTYLWDGQAGHILWVGLPRAEPHLLWRCGRRLTHRLRGDVERRGTALIAKAGRRSEAAAHLEGKPHRHLHGHSVEHPARSGGPGAPGV
jgi:predicted metal-dependent phosphoesterase TrpH